MAKNLTVDDTPITDGDNGLSRETFMDFVRRAVKANEVCETANAARTAVRKLARGAGIKMKQFDAAIAMTLMEPGDVREIFEAQYQYATWLELPGHKQLSPQLDMFLDLDPDTTSADDWESKGFIAATTGRGAFGEPPADCPPERIQSWMSGWHRGQDANKPAKFTVVS